MDRIRKFILCVFVCPSANQNPKVWDNEIIIARLFGDWLIWESEKWFKWEWSGWVREWVWIVKGSMLWKRRRRMDEYLMKDPTQWERERENLVAVARSADFKISIWFCYTPLPPCNHNFFLENNNNYQLKRTVYRSSPTYLTLLKFGSLYWGWSIITFQQITQRTSWSFIKLHMILLFLFFFYINSPLSLKILH